MSKIKCAFAYPFNHSHGDTVFYSAGMNMRQYYKAAALQGLLASGPHDCEVADLVHDAALYANAMLAEDIEWNNKQLSK